MKDSVSHPLKVSKIAGFSLRCFPSSRATTFPFHHQARPLTAREKSIRLFVITMFVHLRRWHHMSAAGRDKTSVL
jgi:hypothetical protein